MNTAAGFLNHVSSAWWHYTTHATWQAAMAAVVVLGLAALGRKWPAPWRYGLLLVALLKFAVPPFVSAPSGAFSQLGPRVATVSPALQQSRSAYLSQPALAWAGAPGAAVREVEMAGVPRGEDRARQAPQARLPAAEAVRGPRLRWAAWLMLVHLAGGGLVLLWIAGQLGLLHRAVGVGRPVTDGPLRLMLEVLAAELGLKRIPALKISNRITSPVAFGVLRPTILLPATKLSRLSQGELRVILAHELAHFRRRDLWVNWAQLLLQAVWWFNPLLWMLNRALRNAREDCCDDLLLARNLTSKDQYCDTLMRAAVEFGPQQRAAGALGFGERLHPLGRRFARIMDGRLPRAYRLSALGFVVLLGVGFLLLPGLRSQTAVPGHHSDTSSSQPLGSAFQIRLLVDAPSADLAPATLATKTGDRTSGGACDAWEGFRLDRAALLKAKRDTNGFREIVGKFPQTAGVDGPVATNRTARILGAFTKERARTLFGEMERWWTERLDGGLWPSGKTAWLNAGRSLTVETEERVHGAPRLHLPVVTTNGTVRCVLPVPLFDMCVTTNGTARFSGVFTEAQARTLADEMARWLTERFAEGPSRSGEKSTPAPAFGRRAGGSM